MKRWILFIIALAAVIPNAAADSHLKYKEQYYRIYTQHMYSNPENIAESMYYLEKTLSADFANPLYALAAIKTPTEWEHYRNLFTMHVYLMLTDLSCRMAGRYDRQSVSFYHAPWRDENLESLATAEKWYRYGLQHWERAKEWAVKVKPFGPNLIEVQHWEDDAYRVRTLDLDYGDIIADHLKRLERIRATLEAMDETTY